MPSRLQSLADLAQTRQDLIRAQNRPGLSDEDWEEITRQIAELDAIVEMTFQQE